MPLSAASLSRLLLRRTIGWTLAATVAPLPAYAVGVELPEPLGARTVAGAEGLAAAWLNPASLTLDGATELALLGNGRGALGLGVAGGGLGLSLRQRQGPSGGDEVGMHLLLPLATGLTAGGTWRVGRRNGVAGQDADLGLLWHPTANWSVGYAHRGLAATVAPASAEQLGLAWRPNDERLTFSLDHAWMQGRIDQGRTSLAAQWQLAPGLQLMLQTGRDLAFAAAALDELRIGVTLGHGRHSMGMLVDGDATQGAAPTVAAGWRFVDRPAPSAVWPDKVVVAARLGGSLAPKAGLAGLLQSLPPRPATALVLEALERNGRDPEVQALALRLDPLDLSLGELQELREGLSRFRRAGKRLYIHVSGGGLPELYVASVADRIFLSPGAQLDVSGFADEVLMYGDLLKQSGIHADFVATGPFKSAVEPYLRNRLSEDAKAQLASLLHDRSEQILTGLAEARNLPMARLRTLVDQGLLRAEQPQGLADETCHPDEIEARLCKELEIPEAEALLERFPADRAWARPRIAVITLQGTMARGTSGADLLMGEVLGSEDAVSVLDQARKDDEIAGVVLRIESPGGDADAAEEIRRAVERLAAAKPVATSVGPVAASGGYWVACGTPWIFAEPGSITGSIGVFSGKLSFGGLMGRLGVSLDGAQEGKLANASTIARPFSAEERQWLEDSIQHTYRRFLDLVARARKKDFKDVESLASGRVYTGRQAAQVGLVDALGGLDDARAWVAAKAGLAADEPVVLYGRARTDVTPVLTSLAGDHAGMAKGLVGLTRWTTRRTWAMDPRFQAPLSR